LPLKNKYPNIKYTSRDFNSIRRDLNEYAKRYYTDTYKDFSEAGFGSLMVDSVSYIGDILSFYLDYSVNESFLDTAIEFDNIIKIGKQMGYRFNSSPASFGTVDLYIIVPSLSVGQLPDPSYYPILKRGSTFSSLGGVNFTLTENVNFGNPNNEFVFARVDPTTGTPTSFAIKASGRVMSGKIETEEAIVGNFKEFLTVPLKSNNISEIISVIDSEGNQYYQVDYLAQDVVYLATTNQVTDRDITQASMRPFSVPRRFVLDRQRNQTILQFGHGDMVDQTTLEPLVEPSKIVIESLGRDYYTDSTFDPTNLIKTDKLGVAPANTTLTIIYRENTSDTVNASSNSITSPGTPFFEFQDETSLDATKVLDVINSLEVNNTDPIVGDVSSPSADELKTRIYNVFSSQNRAVTQEDYKSLCYSMPSKFGAIKRVNVRRDPSSFKRNLNLYILSEDSVGNFIRPNTTIKENLKMWLNSSRMINDSIDILDGKIINVGIEYSAVSLLDANKYDVLESANTALNSLFSRKLEIGEPLFITDIYSTVNKVDGIADVTRVKIIHKTGINYSSQAFNIEESYSDDGRYLNAPDNAVFEVKFPDVDIKGSIK